MGDGWRAQPIISPGFTGGVKGHVLWVCGVYSQRVSSTRFLPRGAVTIAISVCLVYIGLD